MVSLLQLRAVTDLDSFWALLDAWRDYMGGRELSPATIEQHEAYLLRALRRMRLSPSMVSASDLERFLVSVAPKGSNRQAYVAAFRSFFGFAIRRGYLDMTDPSSELRARAPKYPPPDFFGLEEVAAILEAASRRRPARRRPALVLLFETGARIGSLAAVGPQDVSAERITFRVTKNDRPYAVPLTPAAQDAARELLELHEGWESLIGVHTTTLGNWFRDAARDAGLPEGRVHAHLARHTAATIMYERTKDPLLVKDFLNHADLSQVHRYARVKEERLVEALASSITR